MVKKFFLLIPVGFYIAIIFSNSFGTRAINSLCTCAWAKPFSQNCAHGEIRHSLSLDQQTVRTITTKNGKEVFLLIRSCRFLHHNYLFQFLRHLCYKLCMHLCLWKILSQNCPHGKIRHSLSLDQQTLRTIFNNKKW